MTVYRKISGGWEPTTQYYKVSGSWERTTWYYKVNGSWEAVSNVVVDNFEDGDASEWTTSGTGTRSIVGGLDGTSFAWEHDGFSEVHLAGADAVDRGPQPGDQFEFWFVIGSTSGSVINRFEFSADGINENDVYRVEFERETGDNELSIEKISGGSQALIDTDPNFGPSIDQVYRCEINWNVGNNAITAQMFTPSGTAASTDVSISDDSSAAGSDFTQPGIFIRTNDNNVCTWDEIRITN